MNRLGSGPARIVIIPFLGGAAIPARPPSSEFRDVLISLAGPVFGLLAMAPFYAVWAATGDARWLEGAFFVAFISLLNLVPAPPLDGSRALGPALAKIHPQVERGVLVLIGALAVWWAVSRGSWLLAAFLGFSFLGALRRPSIRPPAMKLSGREFVVAVALYVGAAVLCLSALGLSMTSIGLPPTPGAVARLFAFG
jgi:Zn-dependent protease